MSIYYNNPALDAELAYRREVLQASGRGTRTRASGLVPQPPAGALTVPPGPDLSEVRATIVDVPRWDDAPMVGRAEELARLLAHVDRAADGRPSAVLLAGDAGVGKTRLLDELTSRAAERGVRVLTGHCVDLGDVGLPYLPFVDLLRPVAADPDAGAHGRGQPRSLRPACRPTGRAPCRPGTAVTSAARCRTGRPPTGRRRPAAAVRVGGGAVCELAAAGPLLLVLEDVHWADRSSRDLLRYLLARLVDEPVVVVASYRSDDLHRRHPLRPLLAELVRLPGVERLELAPLPDAEVGEPRPGLAGGGSREHGGRRRGPGRGQRVLRRGAARRRPPRRGAAPRAHRRAARARGAALARPPSRCCGSRPSPAGGCGTSWWPPSAGWRRESWSGARRDGPPPPAGRLRRRPLPLPARAAARGGARRPAAGGAGAAARCHRRLPRRDARRRDGGGAGAPRPREQRPARRAGRIAGGGGRGLSVGAPAEQLQHLETALALWSAVPDAAS